MPFDGVFSAIQRVHEPQEAGPPVAAGRDVAPIGRRRWRDVLGRVFGPRGRGTADLRPAVDPDLAALHLLEEARRMIETPERWTQGAYRTLRAHCAIGALRATARHRKDDRPGLALAHGLLQDVAIRRGFPTVQSMNDQSAHGAVLSAFDEAVAAARRRTAS